MRSLQALRAGQYCYVLDSRQVGKTSLLVRTAARLRSEGDRAVVLDLSAYGNEVTPEQWYFGMLYTLADQLEWTAEAEAFWERHADLGLVQRWVTAIREWVRRHPGLRLIVFVNEINAVKGLRFPAEEFFAAIRECYSRRTQDAAFSRLVFCLVGVSTPSELIHNPLTTPFNIGLRIVLEDFRLLEAAPPGTGP